MRSLLILSLLAASLFGGVPSNSVTIYDKSGSAQTARLTTISRIFAQGEFGAFVRPEIGGTPIAQFQNDVKSRWADGSLKHVIVTFPVTLPSNGSVVVKFSASTDPCHAGSQSACDAAGLTSAQMLVFNGGNWGGVISATNGNTYTASARTMLTDGNFEYWLRGPLVTEVRARDRLTRNYDFGWHCTANCSWRYSTSTWIDDPINKSLHPEFGLQFYTGSTAVRVEFIMENVWAMHLQDEKYDLTLATGPSGVTTRFTRTGLLHYNRQRWHKTYWDGTAPGAVNVDYGLDYLMYSRAIPVYKKRVITEGEITQDVAVYSGCINSAYEPVMSSLTCSTGAARSGSWLMDMANTGGRGDLAIIPRWYLIYLFTFDSRLYDTSFLGNADLAGLAEWHVRESQNTRYFVDTNGDGNPAPEAVPAQGRVVSVDARPGAQMFYDYNIPGFSYSVPGDKLVAVGSIQQGGDYDTPSVTGFKEENRTRDAAHLPGFSYVPYIITGELYHLEELQFQASWLFIKADPNPFYRWGAMGNQYDQTRGVAWAMRTIGDAIFSSPDAAAEKTYFLAKWKTQIALMEGSAKIPNPEFPPAVACNPNTDAYWLPPNQAYCLSYRSGWIPGNIIGFTEQWYDTVTWDDRSNQEFDWTYAYAGSTDFMQHMLAATLAWGVERGLPGGKNVVPLWAAALIPPLLDERYNPGLLTNYQSPTAHQTTPAVTQGATSYSGAFTVQLDFVPWWIIPPTTVSIQDAGGGNGESVRICSVDRVARTITSCTQNGRGYSADGAMATHAVGSHVYQMSRGSSYPIVGEHFASWYDQLQANAAGRRTWTPGGWNQLDYSLFAYPYILRGVMGLLYPYAVAGYRGHDAWKFAYDDITAHDPRTPSVTDSPMWDLMPRFDPVKVRSIPGDTFVILEYTKPRADEACTVDGVSDGVTASRLVRFVKSGLTAESSGSLTIACASDPYGNTVASYTTLSTLSGTGTYSWTAPGGNTSINYGNTPSLGSSSPASDCSAGCSVSLPKGLQYVQLSRSGGTVGAIQPVVIGQ
jgi:hypothetical protein